MKFNVDELEVIFPYDYVYPGRRCKPQSSSFAHYFLKKEQYAYMVELKRTLDAKVRTQPAQCT